MADADLTIVILRQVQSDLSELKTDMTVVKGDVREIKEKVEIISERLGNVERREVIREAQSNVERRNDSARDQRIEAEIEDLKIRVARLEQTERG